MKKSAVIPCAALAAASLFSTASAQSPAIVYGTGQQPAGLCQPAREYPDVRVRQMEIDNIGTTNAYVVCSPQALFTNGRLTRIFIAFENSGPTERKVVCTLQNSYIHKLPPVETITKDVTMVGGGYGWIIWGQPDFPAEDDLGYAGIQCILPGGVSMGWVTTLHIETHDAVD